VLLLGHPSLLTESPLSQFVLDHLVEVDSLIVVRKVEADLSVVRLECVEVAARRLVLKLVVDLLVEYDGSPLHVYYADVVGPPGVILDEARHAAAALVPSLVTRSLRPVYLDYCCG